MNRRVLSHLFGRAKRLAIVVLAGVLIGTALTPTPTLAASTAHPAWHAWREDGVPQPPPNPAIVV